VLKAFAAIVPDDAEPSGVADEIVKVVDMPFGKRPFPESTTIRPKTAPMSASSCSTACRAEMLHRVGPLRPAEAQCPRLVIPAAGAGSHEDPSWTGPLAAVDGLRSPAIKRTAT